MAEIRPMEGTHRTGLGKSLRCAPPALLGLA